MSTDRRREEDEVVSSDWFKSLPSGQQGIALMMMEYFPPAQSMNVETVKLETERFLDTH